MSYIIAKKDDEFLKAGEKYPIVSDYNGMIDVEVNNMLICIDKTDDAVTIVEGKYCSCCSGDNAVYWEDSNNCAFIDNKGQMLVIKDGKEMQFSVNYCPVCGEKLT